MELPKTDAWIAGFLLKGSEISFWALKFLRRKAVFVTWREKQWVGSQPGWQACATNAAWPWTRHCRLWTSGSLPEARGLWCMQGFSINWISERNQLHSWRSSWLSQLHWSIKTHAVSSVAWLLAQLEEKTQGCYLWPWIQVWRWNLETRTHRQAARAATCKIASQCEI